MELAPFLNRPVAQNAARSSPILTGYCFSDAQSRKGSADWIPRSNWLGTAKTVGHFHFSFGLPLRKAENGRQLWLIALIHRSGDLLTVHRWPSLPTAAGPL